MTYPTQHENFYKNRIVQLQQKLQQLTEVYNYRLNEATRPPPVRVPRVPRVVGSGGTIIRGLGINATNYASRVANFLNMSPADIIAAINDGGIGFTAYVAQNYGRIVQVGSSYQRLLPDGTLLGYTSHNTWVNINKPGFMSAFGPVSANGIVIPMNVYRQMGHGGISPADITYSPGRPISPYGGRLWTEIIPYQGPDPMVVPPM